MNGTNGNEPGYPEKALVPYPVILAATKGDPDAMKIVLQHFSGYIARLSMRKLYDERGNVYFGVDHAKCTRAGNIDHRPIGVCQRKRAEPPYLTRAPSTILNELICIAPGRSRQQHLNGIKQRVSGADTVQQCRR